MTRLQQRALTIQLEHNESRMYRLHQKIQNSDDNDKATRAYARYGEYLYTQLNEDSWWNVASPKLKFLVRSWCYLMDVAYNSKSPFFLRYQDLFLELTGRTVTPKELDTQYFPIHEGLKYVVFNKGERLISYEDVMIAYNVAIIDLHHWHPTREEYKREVFGNLKE